MNASETRYWLQSVGEYEDPLRRDWRLYAQHGGKPSLVTHVWTTPRPASWRLGHVVIYYATFFGTLTGIVTLAGDSEQLGEGQWGWRTPVCPILLLDPEDAPELPDVGVAPPRFYTEIDAATYAQFRDLMVASISV